LAVDLRAVDFLAVDLRAVDFLAGDFLAAAVTLLTARLARFATEVFRAVDFFAVVRLVVLLRAVDFLAAAVRFPGDFFVARAVVVFRVELDAA
jgi:hypothetical protein